MKRYRNGWWLEVKYWDEGLTQREIAEECGVSPRLIRKYMNRFDIPTREMRGENHPMHGRERTEEEKRKISESLDGRSLSDETRRKISEAQRGRELPENVREKIAESLEGLNRSEATRRKMSESTAGETNPNWRGGYSDRYGPGWSVARENILKRDEVCQHCGRDGTNHQLDVHHIIPVRVFRQADHLSLGDAHDERNLVLLCSRCHGRADHGQIEFDAPVELLFEPKRKGSSESGSTNSHPGGRAI
ncbi:NUMOD3 domain-containing DNA-binding protein [Halorussus rarus]|uniref:NUMOD3 domain-containing DNA-binding protein n=1 Tax=Halorussus TaxID=1070314 RepID=UPI000E21954E|nr:NUMOD3 domain-containing DNA-binding protein [Halorussus rarus]NHN59303.1 winged helix-turn-helix transcriptional regulator [Halorussus sp. JP-T4]